MNEKEGSRAKTRASQPPVTACDRELPRRMKLCEAKFFLGWVLDALLIIKGPRQRLVARDLSEGVPTVLFLDSLT